VLVVVVVVVCCSCLFVVVEVSKPAAEGILIMAEVGDSSYKESLPSLCSARGFQAAKRAELPAFMREWLSWLSSKRLHKKAIVTAGSGGGGGEGGRTKGYDAAGSTGPRRGDRCVAHFDLRSPEGHPLMSSFVTNDPLVFDSCESSDGSAEGVARRDAAVSEGRLCLMPCVDAAVFVMNEGEVADFEVVVDIVMSEDELRKGTSGMSIERRHDKLLMRVALLQVEMKEKDETPVALKHDELLKATSEIKRDVAGMSDRHRILKADALKLRGNEAFKLRGYDVAEQWYTLALNVLRDRAFPEGGPYNLLTNAMAIEATLRMNVSQSQMRRKKFNLALESADEALKTLGWTDTNANNTGEEDFDDNDDEDDDAINTSSEDKKGMNIQIAKALYRRAVALAAVGRPDDAEVSLWSALDKDPSNTGIMSELAKVRGLSKADIEEEARSRLEAAKEAKLARRTAAKIVSDSAADAARKAAAAADAAAHAVKASPTTRAFMAILDHCVLIAKHIQTAAIVLLAKTIALIVAFADSLVPALSDEEEKLEASKPKIDTTTYSVGS